MPALARAVVKPVVEPPTGEHRLDLDIQLHAPPPGFTGVSLYATRLARHLGPSVAVDLRHRVGKEWTIAGRAVGGNITRLASRWLSVGWGDVVHAADPMSAPRFGKLDVLTVHDVLGIQYPELYGARQAALDRKLLQRALAKRPLVATPTHAARTALLGHTEYDPERVFVSYHGVDPDVLAGAAGERPTILEGDTPTILLNMDDNPRKRADLVLEACRDLDVRIVHVGARRPSYGAVGVRLERLAKPLGGRYARIERVDAATLGALYAHCDLFVHLTHDEGFGMPPLEAMACGAPVVASDVAVLREILGPHARYTRLTADAARDAIEAALAVRPDTRGAAAHANTYTWTRHAREMAALYLRAKHPDNPAAWT